MNTKQYTFVTEYLRSSDHIMAYKNAYQSTSDYTTIESAANRLLKHPEVAQAIREAQTAIRQQVEREVAEKLKGELLTIQRKRELLYQIATGEMYVEQNYKGKNCSQCTQFIRPSINQMLKAIDLDNKLAGHYGTKEKNITFPVFREGGANAMSDGRVTSAPTPSRHAELDSASREIPTKKEQPEIPITIGTQQNTTNNTSPLHGDRGTTLPARHAELGSASRQTQQTKEKPETSQQNTTNNASPLQGDRGTNIPYSHTETHTVTVSGRVREKPLPSYSMNNQHM